MACDMADAREPYILAVTGLRREARIVGRQPRIRTISSGGNGATLTKRLDEASGDQVLGIISIGIAGALSPTLRPGDVVIGTAVLGDSGRLDTDRAWRNALAAFLPEAFMLDILGADSMVTESRRKASLHAETGAGAIDMESHIAAEAALRDQRPFAALRVISDAAGQDLPNAVTAGIKPDGKMNIGGVARAIGADPMQIPALIRTGLDAEKAFRALLRCCDVLGPGLGFPDFREPVLDMA